MRLGQLDRGLARWIVVGFFVWPVVHLVMYPAAPSAWAHFGWGMYSTPSPTRYVSITVVACEDAATCDEDISALAGDRHGPRPILRVVEVRAQGVSPVVTVPARDPRVLDLVRDIAYFNDRESASVLASFLTQTEHETRAVIVARQRFDVAGRRLWVESEVLFVDSQPASEGARVA